MFKVSQIISKEVISVYEGQSLGTVKNVVLNPACTKVTHFVFFHDESDHDSAVTFANVFAFSEDCLLVKNISKTQFFAQQETTPIHRRVFGLDATDHGKICDITLDDKGNVLYFVTTTGKQWQPSEVLFLGDICMVKQEQKVRITSFKPKQNQPKNEILNQIQVKIVALPEGETIPILPPRISPNAQSLIGRRVAKTITGLNNEVIIRQNNVISTHTLDMAKLHNKTHELMTNVL